MIDLIVEEIDIEGHNIFDTEPYVPILVGLGTPGRIHRNTQVADTISKQGACVDDLQLILDEIEAEGVE